MMTLRQALNLNKDDYVFDMCGRRLKIVDYIIKFEGGQAVDVNFGCYYYKDNILYKLKYNYNEIYQNFDDLCDEYKFFLNWLQQQDNMLSFNSDTILLLRTAYLGGFTDGLQYQQHNLAQEQLQK